MLISSFALGFALLTVTARASPLRWIPVQMHTYSLEMPVFSAYEPCFGGFLGIELSSAFPL